MHPLKYLIGIVPFMLVLAAMGSGAKNPVQHDPNRLKADYIYYEAVHQLNEDNLSDGYMMLRRANELNPADIDIAAQLGEIVLLTNFGTEEEFKTSYEAMKRRFFDNPEDYMSGLRFAYIAQDNDRYNDVLQVYSELTRVHPDRTDFMLEYADKLIHASQLDGSQWSTDSAMAIFDRLEQTMGLTIDLVGRRIAAYSLSNDTAAIVNELMRLRDTAPNEAPNLLNVAECFRYFNMADSADKYYDEACSADSTFGPAFMSRANFYLERGDTTLYNNEVVNVVSSPGLEFDDKIQMLGRYTGTFYNEPAKRPEISRMFAIMEDQHPGQADLHSLYGAYLEACDSNAAAMEQFGYAIDLSPDDQSNYKGKLDNAIAINDTTAIITAGSEAAHRFTDNFYFSLVTSNYVMQRQSPQAALDLIDLFDVESEEQPKVTSVYYQMRGDLLYKIEMPDSAFAEYERALIYDPDNSGAQNNAAYFMAVEGVNLDRAENLIKRAVATDVNNPTYLDTYAWVLFRKKDYQGARQQIDHVLDIYNNPTDTSTYVNTKAEDVEIDDVVDTTFVEELIISEIETDNNNDDQPSAEVYDHAGDIYFMTGEPEKALEFWELALALDPNNEKIKKKVQYKTYFFE